MAKLVSSPFIDFAGGLQLVDQASEYDSNRCLDDLNVRFGQSGEVRTRGGSSPFTSFAEDDVYDTVFYTEAGGPKRVLGTAGTRLRAVDLAGASVASGAATAGGTFSFAAFGAPTQARVYGVNGTDFVYWDGTAWVVNPTITFDGVAGKTPPKGNCCVVSPWDNRLLVFGYALDVRGPNGVLGSPSTMFYSDQGDPQTWKTTWRETMTPGDGERFVAAVLWRDRIFAFKQSKFFVFYGATSDGSGNPRQQYYAVDTDCGVDGPRAVCAGRDGVYFLDHRGLYRTTGNEPELISPALDPLFTGLDPPFYRGPRPDQTVISAQGSVTFCNERIHVGFPTATGYASWVYDPRYDWWSVDTLPVRAAGVLPNVDGERLLYGRPVQRRMFQHGASIVGDGQTDGSTNDYASRWRSSWQTFGVFGEKILHRIRLWGAGEITVGCATDFGSIERRQSVALGVNTDLWGDGTDATDLWGDGSNPADLWGGGESYRDGWVSGDWRGSVHSIEIAGRGQRPFAVQRFENHLGVTLSPTSDYAANASVS